LFTLTPLDEYEFYALFDFLSISIEKKDETHRIN